MEQVIPLGRIEREARAAALQYSDVNDACPYPFGSDAGHAFSQYFKLARAEAQALQEVIDEDPDDSPFCECGNQPTIEESDWNKCDSCGKALA